MATPLLCSYVVTCELVFPSRENQDKAPHHFAQSATSKAPAQPPSGPKPAMINTLAFLWNLLTEMLLFTGI